MRVEASNYFELIVEPTYADYLARPWDFRLAILAIVVMSHMIDYFVMGSYDGESTRRAMGIAVADARRRLIAECPDLEKVADAADAAKHGRLADLLGRPRHVQSVNQLQVTPSLFSAPWGQGVFAEAADVYVRSGTGSPFSARAHLASAADYWRGKLAEGGAS